MCRRCGERDKRGNAKNRRRRKQAILDRDGDGTTVVCTWAAAEWGCGGTVLTFDTMEQDRLERGSTYRLDNVVAACPPCNKIRTYRAVVIPDGCAFGPEDPDAPTP